MNPHHVVMHVYIISHDFIGLTEPVVDIVDDKILGFHKIDLSFKSESLCIEKKIDCSPTLI